MPRIIRCPECFTFVYDDVQRCHGCGGRVKRRKLLGRGSWAFIAIVATIFTVVRGVSLAQDRRERINREVERSFVAQDVSRFMKLWLKGEDLELRSDLPDRARFLAELDCLREAFPDVLPAEKVIEVEATWSASQYHRQATGGLILHVHTAHGDPSAFTGNVEAEDRHPSVRSKAPASLCNEHRSRTRGREHRYATWLGDQVAFFATVIRGGARYEVRGRACIMDRVIHCVEIDRVESTSDGRVISPSE